MKGQMQRETQNRAGHSAPTKTLGTRHLAVFGFGVFFQYKTLFFIDSIVLCFLLQPH